MTDFRRLHYSYARFALLEALRIANVNEGDSVLMPGFICRDVLAPVHALRAIPVFYEVDRTLQPLLAKQHVSARAIIAVNYFGFPQQLGELQHLASQTGAILIEDNAHGYLSCDDNGTVLGQRTGLGFTSFRKTLRVVNGAFLDVDIQAFPRGAQLVEPPTSTRRLPVGHQVRRAVGALQRVSGLPMLNIAREAIRAARNARGRPAIPQSNESETVMPSNSSIHESSLTVLSNINAQRESDRRRALYQTVAERLQAAQYSLVFASLPRNVVPWCVPFTCSTDDLHRARRTLRGLGVEIFQWPDLPNTVRGCTPKFYSQVHIVSMMV